MTPPLATNSKRDCLPGDYLPYIGDISILSGEEKFLYFAQLYFKMRSQEFAPVDR